MFEAVQSLGFIRPQFSKKKDLPLAQANRALTSAEGPSLSLPIQKCLFDDNLYICQYVINTILIIDIFTGYILFLLFIASYYRQFSADSKTINHEINSRFVNFERLQARANKTGIYIIVYNYNS